MKVLKGSFLEENPFASCRLSCYSLKSAFLRHGEVRSQVQHWEWAWAKDRVCFVPPLLRQEEISKGCLALEPQLVIKFDLFWCKIKCTTG